MKKPQHIPAQAYVAQVKSNKTTHYNNNKTLSEQQKHIKISTKAVTNIQKMKSKLSNNNNNIHSTAFFCRTT